MAAQIQPNTTQIPNFFLDTCLPLLSDTALRVLLVITRQTLGWIEDPHTKTRKAADWISYSQLKAKTGRSNEALTKAIRELEVRKLIDITGNHGQPIPLELRRGRRLYYRIHTSPKIEEVDQNLTDNRNSEIGDTKETLTKDNLHYASHNASEADIVENLLREKGKIQHEYQYLGLEVFNRLQAPKTKRAECIRIAKTYPAGKVTAAFSFAKDYPNPPLKWKMFLWKLNKLNKGELAYDTT